MAKIKPFIQHVQNLETGEVFQVATKFPPRLLDTTDAWESLMKDVSIQMQSSPKTIVEFIEVMKEKYTLVFRTPL